MNSNVYLLEKTEYCFFGVIGQFFNRPFLKKLQRSVEKNREILSQRTADTL